MSEHSMAGGHLSEGGVVEGRTEEGRLGEYAGYAELRFVAVVKQFAYHVVDLPLATRAFQW